MYSLYGLYCITLHWKLLLDYFQVIHTSFTNSFTHPIYSFSLFLIIGFNLLYNLLILHYLCNLFSPAWILWILCTIITLTVLFSTEYSTGMEALDLNRSPPHLKSQIVLLLFIFLLLSSFTLTTCPGFNCQQRYKGLLN